MLALLLKLKGAFYRIFKNKITVYVCAALIILLTVGIFFRACDTARTIERAEVSSDEARAGITRALDRTATITETLGRSTDLNRAAARHLEKAEGASINITTGITGIKQISKRIRQIISKIETQNQDRDVPTYRNR